MAGLEIKHFDSPDETRQIDCCRPFFGSDGGSLSRFGGNATRALSGQGFKVLRRWGRIELCCLPCRTRFQGSAPTSGVEMNVRLLDMQPWWVPRRPPGRVMRVLQAR